MFINNVDTSCPVNIFVNQGGYASSLPKSAVMPFAADEFYVVGADDNIVYMSAKTNHFGFDKASGDDVYYADFSSLERCGKYYIRTQGGRSFDFVISENPFENAAEKMLKSFYYQRCGCELTKQYAGEYVHAPCHTDPALLWENHSVNKNVCGGWHDAGDYGRYVTAGATAVAHMLYAYKLFPNPFDKIVTNIPDHKNDIPDVLTECRYELEWIMKMQNDEGGVYHKATTKGHAGFVMPEDDTDTVYLLPVSSSATADTAAVLALAANIYGKFDSEFADKLKNCALKSWEWLEKNPDFIFDSPKECTTGGYGEHDDISNRLWAAAELFALCGDDKFKDYFHSNLDKTRQKVGFGYVEMGGFASLAYILANQNKSDTIVSMLKSEFSKEAKILAEISDNCGYGTAIDPEHYGWGSNMAVMVSAIKFAVASVICGEKKYDSYAVSQYDYLLGKNALGFSYVTGIGEYCCNYPHMRFSFADGVEKCMEGLVSGGPNMYPCDELGMQIIPKNTPPMKCFADQTECFSLNEVAIYWNSVAVFTAAYLSDIAQK